MERDLKEKHKKEHIKKAAIALFAKNGFEKTSIMEICNSANVNNAMVSYYFRGKMALYKDIIEDSLQNQINYISNSIKIEDFKKLSHKEKVEEFIYTLNKFISIFYDEISSDLVLLLLKEQQSQHVDVIHRFPIITYFCELISSILNLPDDSKEVIYITLSIIAQITFPQILSGLSFALLKQRYFGYEDLEIIRENLETYLPVIVDKYFNVREILSQNNSNCVNDGN